MKQIIKYKCELCGSTYDTEEDAEHCEVLHEAPIKIVKSEYKPGGDIPSSIHVEFSDDFVGIYLFERYDRTRKLKK